MITGAGRGLEHCGKVLGMAGSRHGTQDEQLLWCPEGGV